ncbi:adenylate cyclase [Sinorhizobium americanum CCGM7]|uniref:adenylate/guanylate cyclase domain-containing protein n=1 Tax=Sinorhizobium americanum TaxID=194963 RepID=UPI0004D409D3|nr:adenylate/guanylate cyclase domain-containing protein [Sinorhizobium americanum]APG84800.1 adenylate cyclase [Sinorhizobium americanum CCGM7]
MPTNEAKGRHLAVVLAADVAGYSRLMSEDEEATLSLLTKYQEIIAGLVAEHRGRVFNMAGDGVMVEFASAVQAVRCAVAIQRALGRRNIDLPERRRMMFRIGINLGDVIARGGDLFGDGVNIAARLQTLDEPGDICISASVHDQIVGKLSFACECLGEKTLKNIARPVRAYRVRSSMEPPVPITELQSGSLALPDKPSIAVMPFVNMSGDAEQDYFADGLTEDLITALAKFRWFFVIARNSSFTYKNRAATVQQIGSELGVRYVLEGSTRKSSDRVRVTAQLVEAETGHHVWAERYDRDLAELFALQDEIVDRVAGAIEPEMLRMETLRVRRKAPENLTAWELIFRGMWHFYQFTPAEHRCARELFRKAIVAAPDIAEGYTWLGRCNAGTLFFRWSENPAGDMAEGWQAALRAAQLAETDPYAHYAVGIMSVVMGRLHRAMEAAQRSIDLSPSFALGYMLLGMSRLFLGRAGQAIEPFQRGLRLSPHDPLAFLWLHFLAFAHFLTGEYEESLQPALNAAAKRPDLPSTHCALACCLVELGRQREAEQAAAEMQRNSSEGQEELGEFVSRFVNPEQREQIRTSLRKAGWQGNW